RFSRRHIPEGELAPETQGEVGPVRAEPRPSRRGRRRDLANRVAVGAAVTPESAVRGRRADPLAARTESQGHYQTTNGIGQLPRGNVHRDQLACPERQQSTFAQEG